MPYARPQPLTKLPKAEKIELLKDYIARYRLLVEQDTEQLNIKLSRKHFEAALDEVGDVLLKRSKELASSLGPVHDFLQDTPLPGDLSKHLPDDFRAFCLLLNAVKQWVAAEQAATDRFLLGGTARSTLRTISSTCTLTGDSLTGEEIELHHPVRDGRPPIPVSKVAHAKLEKQTSRSKLRIKVPLGSIVGSGDDQAMASILLALKKSGNRSWIMLRKGCLDLLDRSVIHSTSAVKANSRAFARKVVQATGKDPEWIIGFLDERGLA